MIIDALHWFFFFLDDGASQIPKNDDSPHARARPGYPKYKKNGGLWQRMTLFGTFSPMAVLMSLKTTLLIYSTIITQGMKAHF